MENMTISKKNIIVTVVLVLIVAFVGYFVYKTINVKDYSIVYLTTGEVYIGKLSTFPDLQLKDSYILQVTKDTTDPSKNNFQLQPLTEALWSPKSLHLNRTNVVFYGPLSENSKIAQKLAEQKPRP